MNETHIRKTIIEAIKPYARKFEARGKAIASKESQVMNDFDAEINDFADDLLGDLKRHDRSVQSQIECAVSQAVERAKAECLSQYEDELAHLNNVVESLQGQLKNARLVDPTNKTIGILEAKLSTSLKANKALMQNIESLTKTIKELL